MLAPRNWFPNRFQATAPPPARRSSTNSAAGIRDLGFSDASTGASKMTGRDPAPEAVRDTGGTVRDRVGGPLPVGCVTVTP